MTYMLLLNCALKLVEEVILFLFYFVLCIFSPFVYSSLFATLYTFTDHCHRVETQLQ